MGHIDDLYDRDKREVLGDGTYATVFAATCKRTGERVALKKLRRMGAPPLPPSAGKLPARADGSDDATGGGGVDDRGGVGQAALREIKVLQELRHPHIVRLRETLPHKDTLVLVFDYAARGDLELLLYPPWGPQGDSSSGGGEDGDGQARGSGGGGGGGGGGGRGGGGEAGGKGLGPLPPGVVKAHLKALLEALAYCHEQGVLHRDVKPNNLLLDGEGRLLLADFGLARYLPREAASQETDNSPPRPSPARNGVQAAAAGEEEQEEEGEQELLGCFGEGDGTGVAAAAGAGARAPCGSGGLAGRPVDRDGHRSKARDEHLRPVMTHQVGMLWYRPPELLFGCRTYDTGIDVWAVGCVFAEMMLRRVWFMGTSDVDQLRLIFEVLGTPSEETWPGVSRLPNFLKFAAVPPRDLAAIFPDATPDALDLLACLTRLCPEQRPTARQALTHVYFTSDPPPMPPGQLAVAVAPLPARGTGADGAVLAERNIWRVAGVTACAVGRCGGGDRSGGGGPRGPGGGGRRRAAALQRVAPPVFQAPRRPTHESSGGRSLPGFHPPMPPPMPSGRPLVGRLSFDAGAGGGSSAGGGPFGRFGLPQHLQLQQQQQPAFSKVHVCQPGLRPDLGFLDRSFAGPAPGGGPFPAPGASAAGDVAAAPAGGGGGDRPSQSLPAFPQAFAGASSMPWYRDLAAAMDERAGNPGGGGDVPARGSSALPYNGLSQLPAPRPPSHHSATGAAAAAAAAAGPTLHADAAASAPRRYRRARRTRSSVATADTMGDDMSLSVGAVGMAGGGRLCFDEVQVQEGEEPLAHLEEEGEEGGLGEEERVAIEMEEDEQEEAEERTLLEEGEENEDEDGFRSCVARRFSFGSSLVTGGDGAIAAATVLRASGRGDDGAAAAAAAAAYPAAHGSGDDAMAITVASGGDGGDDGGGESAVPMATATVTTAADGAAAGGGGFGTATAGYDPMCISVSVCGGGGGGSVTVGSKRPRPGRESINHQPPTPGALVAVANADADRGSGHPYLCHVHVGGDGAAATLGASIRGGSAGSAGSVGIGGAVAVAAAPSVTMASASAAPSISVNAMTVPEGISGGGAAAVPEVAVAPKARQRPPRPSDAATAMSLSLAGGLDAAAAHQAVFRAAPPTVVGPRFAAAPVEQVSDREPRVSAAVAGGGGSTVDAAVPAGLPPVAPRMLVASGDVVASAVAAGGGGEAGDGTAGSSALVVVAAAPAALSGPAHSRPAVERLDNTDLQYLRQRTARMGEALLQASQASEPPPPHGGERGQQQGKGA